MTAWKEFEPTEVVVTTYQAISGAGKTFKDWPEMVGNIIPYIGGEEEKSEMEPLLLSRRNTASHRSYFKAQGAPPQPGAARNPII